jgi:hypothetical protein
MDLRASLALLGLIAAPGFSFGAPLPPPRPEDLPQDPPQGVVVVEPPPQPPPRPSDLPYAPQPALTSIGPFAPVSGADEAACDALLADRGVIADRAAPVVGVGGCGIAAPVTLRAVLTSDRRRIEIAPPPVMRCELAAQIARWIVQDILPLAEARGARVIRIANADAYDCRGRNRQASAKLSEHGKGDALDMRAIEMSDGRSILFAGRSNDMDLAVGLRTSACARFSTVLGPGSDGFHEDHVHVDLQARSNGYRICQWNVR